MLAGAEEGGGGGTEGEMASEVGLCTSIGLPDIGGELIWGGGGGGGGEEGERKSRINDECKSTLHDNNIMSFNIVP